VLPPLLDELLFLRLLFPKVGGIFNLKEDPLLEEFLK
jgi:hypothetical protein